MPKLQPVADKRGYLSDIVASLIRFGWSLDVIPTNARVPPNGMKLILKLREQEIRLRIFAYKITTSGRNRPHERRVEITTTYQSGLTKAAGYQDIVLGVDASKGIYVAVDSRRLKMGGDTHNASSFFDLEGMSVKKGELLLNPRAVSSALFQTGVEHHAFFHADRLADYLFNHGAIHSGAYMPKTRLIVTAARKNTSYLAKSYPARGDAFELSSVMSWKTSSAPLSKRLIDAAERGDFSQIRQKITPEQFEELLKHCREMGILGEQAVLAFERKRLRKLGLYEQANKVERVSLRSVGEGYDILSFEDDGVTKRYLEVKATSGDTAIVDVSIGEWKAATRLEERYYLVRVTHTDSSPQLYFVRNPRQLEKRGLVSRTPTSWRLDLRNVITTA
jgi:hypothetical protein